MPLDNAAHFSPVPLYNVKSTMVDKYRKARVLEPMELVYNPGEINLAYDLPFDLSCRLWLIFLGLHAAFI